MRAHLEGHGLRLCKVRSPSLHKQEGPSWGVEVGTTSRKAGSFPGGEVGSFLGESCLECGLSKHGRCQEAREPGSERAEQAGCSVCCVSSSGKTHPLGIDLTHLE